MAIGEISPIKYGRLLAKTLPKVIETDEEFDRYVAMMEDLDRRAEAARISPEEETLRMLLEQLIKEYDDRIELPDADPVRLLHFLLEQRGLQAVDLTPIFGARSIASLVLNGKRELSKAHIRKLSDFFKVSPAVFLQ